MTAGLRLYRSPLREGESVYCLGNIEQGVYEDGNHKGEKKPKLESVRPSVLSDGRLCWDMADTEGNRALCQSLLPTIDAPPFAYSLDDVAVWPDDAVEVMSQGVGTHFEAKTVEVIAKKRGRKPKHMGK